MRVVSVNSSTLAKVGYDESRQLLQLHFRSGAAYQYFGVPSAVHEALLTAASKGRYFNDAIRDRFPYRGLGGVTISPDEKISPAVAG